MASITLSVSAKTPPYPKIKSLWFPRNSTTCWNAIRRVQTTHMLRLRSPVRLLLRPRGTRRRQKHREGKGELPCVPYALQDSNVAPKEPNSDSIYWLPFTQRISRTFSSSPSNSNFVGTGLALHNSSFASTPPLKIAILWCSLSAQYAYSALSPAGTQVYTQRDKQLFFSGCARSGGDLLCPCE